MKINHGEKARIIEPNNFTMENHYYNKVCNAQVHQIVSFFMSMSKERIIERYCHLHPRASKEGLNQLLSYVPKNIQWSGTDLFHVTTEAGNRKMIVLETNSSPSGHKSMPLLNDHEEMGSYRRLIELSFLPYLKSHRQVEGALAVVYDKNEMEAGGYANALATVTGENVYLVTFYDQDESPSVKFVDGIMEVCDSEGKWIPIRGAIRYVTQRPWNRIPVRCKTVLYNPIIACLSGGRNKRMASKAYDLFNAELQEIGLAISVPETIKDVKFNEVPLWVKRFGGQAVVKNPYSNAGQGVYTITSQGELDKFMNMSHPYDDFIVQSLIGNYHWSTSGSDGKVFHVGMIPNKKLSIYVADLRLMIASTPNGFMPMAMYARRAAKPLSDHLQDGIDSWEMLGTNLSVKTMEGWDSETTRLKLADQKDFNQLGLSLDSLIDGYIQSILSTISIDKMAIQLIGSKKQLKRKLFMSLNGDIILNNEII